MAADEPRATGDEDAPPGQRAGGRPRPAGIRRAHRASIFMPTHQCLPSSLEILSARDLPRVDYPVAQDGLADGERTSMTAEQHEPAEPRRIRDRTRPAMLPGRSLCCRAHV